MSKFPKARVVPYSSVVGSSVTLHDPETERVIGQLAVLNTGGDTTDDRKQRQILVAEDTAKRINCHDDLLAALKDFLSIAAHCEIKSGVCGCGEDMANHSDPMSVGHSPIDMADQAVSKTIADAEAAVAKAEGR